MYPLHKFLLLIGSVLLMTACQNKSNIKPSHAQNRVNLADKHAYEFSGKMSFSDGRDGGSGRIVWHYEKEKIDATLKAPLGSKSWQVVESESGTTLITSKGEVYRAETTEALISEQLGWPVPWTQLSAWVLGQQFNSRQSQLKWADDSFTISENGWQIVYSKLKAYPEGVMPHKMVARKGDYAIKLSVKKWQW